MSREQILGRVREALSVKTDSHVRQVARKTSHALPVLANGPESRTVAVKEFLPFVGPSFEEHVKAFRTLSEKLQTEFVCVPNIESAQQQLQSLATSNRWSKIGLHENELVQATTSGLELETLNTSHEYDIRDLERCDVGISHCDALIAQTASVLVTSNSAGGRALSVLPPHHVVVATADQMVTTMADGYDRLRASVGDQWPSFLSFITGPSRTADIERVLVLGAHGPKKLTVILIGDEPSSWQ
jgi:L-lactate dehydrogenase complex protein LldG